MYEEQRQNRWSDSEQLQVYLGREEGSEREISKRVSAKEICRINIRDKETHMQKK